MFFTDRRFRLPRIWSNGELNKLAYLFHGDIVNISAWKDEDKQGGKYRDYFVNAKTYSITNYPGVRGYAGRDGEIFLDLEADLPDELKLKFDLCYNHTTLEHIFDMKTAFASICDMSRDAVILVLPFSQQQHENESYKDYWRFTPTAIRALFMANGFTVVYESQNDHRNAAIYLFVMASRHPEKWVELLPKNEFIETAGKLIGHSVIHRIFELIQDKIMRRWFDL